MAPAIGGAAASTAFDDAAVGAAEPDTCAHSITCHPRYTVSTILNSLLAVQEEGTGGSRVTIAHHHEKEGGVIDERCPVAHHS